jgi:UPF0755 protein
MTTSNRNESPRDGRGVRQGSVTRGAPISGYRARRGATSAKGIVFMLVLAVVVVGAGVFIGLPAFRSFALGLANGNPATALTYPFVADIVRDDLGDGLTRPMGTSDAVVAFVIEPGDTVKQVAVALTDAKLIKEPLVFQYLVVKGDVANKLQTGTFNLRQTMTPQQIVDRLQKAPEPPPPQVAVSLRAGLRIEQIAAKLETLDLTMKVQDWYDLVQSPPAALIADYPFLAELPKGRSLEGFFGLGVVFNVQRDVTPEEFTRTLLDQWQKDVGQSVIDAAKAKKKNFYDMLVLASIVERESSVDAERAKIAGVYINRLNGLGVTRLLNADPTVVYAADTMKLRAMDISEWPQYLFWGLLGVTDLATVKVDNDLSGYQTYVKEGLPPGPIASPSKASIEAAITPDTSGGYLYFYACPNDQKHKFAKTLAEHSKNIKSC